MADQLGSPRLRKNISPIGSVAAVKSPNTLEAGLTPSSQNVAVVVAQKPRSRNPFRMVAIGAGIALAMAAIIASAIIYSPSKNTANSGRSNAIGTVSAGSRSESMTAAQVSASQASLRQYAVCEISGGLGVASHFNGFFLRDAVARQCSIGGRLAGGNTIYMRNVQIGQGLFDLNSVANACPNPDQGLFAQSDYGVVGGSVNVAQTNVSFGGISYKAGQVFSSFKFPSSCPKTASVVLDWDAVSAALRDVSDQIADLPSALSFSSLEGTTLNLYLRGTTDTEFFVVHASDLEAASNVVFVGSAKSALTTTIIVNVVGASTVTIDAAVQAQNLQSRILWNFNGFTDLFVKSDFYGSLLAPNASFKSFDTQRTFHGTLIAYSFGPDSLTAASMNLVNDLFEGTVFGPCACDPTAQATQICAIDPAPALSEYVHALFFQDVCGFNSDVQGRLYLGGDGSFTNYGFGDRLPGPDSCPTAQENVFEFANYTLVVDGSLTIDNYMVHNGGMNTGNELSVPVFIANQCPYTFGTSFNIASLQSAYQQVSGNMSALTANADSGVTESQFVFYLNSTLDVVIFSVNVADLEAASSLNMVGSVKDSSVTIVINVNKASSSASFVFTNKGMLGMFQAYQQQIIWNFYGFTTVSIGSAQWLGSILAPTADFVTVAGGAEVHGNVYGYSLGCNDEGSVPTMQLDYFPFTGKFYRPCGTCGN
eukprot:TRINITY_DN12507_c0_g2_i1.p1 TRINITY_DN12507_c0_g2~~TRINITY_DN12507_c0_g2_i1.p1  ORF type:complete len:726 (+),score=162.69 TRINITY_DN12507_c0_g2_i1:57-2180(+)